MVFYIGDFSKPIDSSQIIHLTDPSQAETLKDGDVVERWNHVFEWDSNCLKGSTLEEWRSTGDPMCDEALESMFPTSSSSSSTGVDLLERLQSDAAANPEGPSQALLEDVSRLPPDGIAASPFEILEAQAFFLQHSVAIMQSLLHFSLAGGFASPRITKVLQSVSYLVPPKRNSTSNSPQFADITPDMNDRTFSRLLETFQFVLEIMGCIPDPASAPSSPPGNACPVVHCLEPGAEGWKAALRVRLLHGVARRRILARSNFSTSTYSVDEDGIPINQEDMAATLGSFSIAPLWCLARVYPLPFIPPTESEKSSFIATWRHVGFYLGIDPLILGKHFASPSVASKFLASAVLHLLTSSESSPPGSGSGSGRAQPVSFPTIPILLASSNRPPFPRSFEHHCALTRHLLGPSLSTHLRVPRVTPKVELYLLWRRIKEQIPVIFSGVYPRGGWRRKRAKVTREALGRVVRFQLGMRRTVFRARSEGGEVGEGVLGVEAVKPDPEGGRRMVREYRALMVEMVGVMVGGAVVLIGVVMACLARFVGRI